MSQKINPSCFIMRIPVQVLISINDERSSTEIVKIVDCLPTYMLKIVASFKEMGLIDMETSKTDKRSKILKLTRKGKALQEHLSTIYHYLYSDESEKSFSEEQNAIEPNLQGDNISC